MALRRRKGVRERIAQRASFLCEYCLCPESHSMSTFAVEHIEPLAEGGPDEEENLANSCGGCNGFKGLATTGTDPQTGSQARLYHPRRDVWAEHFTWSEDALILIGLTPIGRATIERLRLNRTGVVNLRSLLKLRDLHPPV
jgi:hypothetical protein